MGRPALPVEQRKVFLGARVKRSTIEAIKKISLSDQKQSTGRVIDRIVEAFNNSHRERLEGEDSPNP